jgi:dCTP diphosphatase
MADFERELMDNLDELRAKVNAFVRERDWDQFHSPKNLAMAMIVEAAEVVEHFQWDTLDESKQMSEERRTEIGHELADTFVYLLRLAEVTGVDLIAAAHQKIALNAIKYPVEKSKGSNAKYTEYQR